RSRRSTAGPGSFACRWPALRKRGSWAYGQDRRAGRAARLEVAMRVRRVAQRIALADVDADAARGDVVEQLAGKRGLLGRIGDVVGERRARDVQRALDR